MKTKCIWANGSTLKNGKKGMPERCKVWDCKGVFGKQLPLCSYYEPESQLKQADERCCVP